MRFVVVLLSALLLAPGAASAACTVLQGGTVHLPEGPRAGFTVVLVDDRIADVGSEIPSLTSDADGPRFRDEPCALVELGEGDVVTAGLVTTGGQLGLVEVGLESRSRHHDAEGDPVRAAHVVARSYDPRSAVIAPQRIHGITSAVIEPTGGMVAGQAAVVDLGGATLAEAVAHESVAMVASLNSGSPSEGLRRLSELLDDARAYAANRRAFEQNASRPYVASRLDLEALQPVLAGDLPLVLSADRASVIEAIVAWAADEEVRVVLKGGAEAWRHADALAGAGIAVVLNPYVTGPGSFDQIEGRADNAALLAAAGVDVIISTRSAHFARNLRQLAGNAVRAGMDHAAAVRAISATPARVFGASDRGEIARGAYANVAVWSGDPLEIATRCTRLFIGGAEVELTSRQTDLLERYRELPGSPLPGLPLPGTEDVPPSE